MYAWEVLKSNELDNLFDLKVKKVATRFFSDHWLTTGEIWTLIGMTRYGDGQKRPSETHPTVGHLPQSQRLRVSV